MARTLFPLPRRLLTAIKENMKNSAAFLTAFLTLAFSLSCAKSAPVSISQQLNSISQQLYSFSPMAQIYLKHLKLVDKNSNGVIEKGAGEGYEEFTTKYGNADVGFHANGVTQNADNSKLEEPEIINHYYLTIRFKPEFEEETSAIESEVVAYIYANNIPLVWLDDEQGTVRNAVNHILGMGWQNKQVTLDEAEKNFTRVMDALRIRDLPGAPVASGYGYRRLSDLVIIRESYCFEISQLYFWLFSESKIRSVNVQVALAPYLLHGVIKLTDNNRIIDYFSTSNIYTVSVDQWAVNNPIQCIGDYYLVQAQTNKADNIIEYYEQAAVYNKYDIVSIANLMAQYADNVTPRNHQEIIALGEFVLDNTNLTMVLNSDYLNRAIMENGVGLVLTVLLESYAAINNRSEFDNTVNLLNRYFSDNQEVQQYIDKFWF